jgi:hypothetical protein
MQEIQSIVLDKKDVVDLLSSSGSLHGVLESHKEVIHAMVASYHYESRGYVYDVIVDQAFLKFTSSYSGSFVVQYKLNYTVSCSDVKYDISDRMIFGFLIDVDNSSLTLSGEKIYERGPDEL